MGVMDNYNSELNKTKVIEKVNYLGDFRIIGPIVPAKGMKKIVGYVVMQEKTGRFKGYTVQQTKSLLERFTFVNTELKTNTEDIVNTECSMDRLPIFNLNMQVIDNFGVIILGEIVVDGKSCGYRVIDTNAKVVDLKKEDVIRLSNNGTELLNAKLVNKDSKIVVSAIKKEFTKIEKTYGQIDVSKNTKAEEWRHKRHIEKYVNGFLPIRAIRWIISTKFNEPYNSNLFHFTFDESAAYKAERYAKEPEIIAKECLTPEHGIELNKDDKVIIKKILELEDFDLKYAALCQFFLKSEACVDRIKKYYITRMVNRYDDKNLNQLKDLGVVSPVLEEFAKKIEERHNRVFAYEIEKNKIKPFTITSFTSGKDIAQLGFILDRTVLNKYAEQNNGDYHFVTQTGQKVKLRYVGDLFDCSKYLGDDDDYEDLYERVKSKARCLGDIVSVAVLQKLIYTFNDVFYNGASETHWRKEDKNNIGHPDALRACMEIIISIAYIYGSETMKEFVEGWKPKLNDEIKVSVPDFDEVSTTDYKLDPRLRLYYESGFYVFYQDSDKTRRGEVYEYYDIDSCTKVVNYRRLNNTYNIKHPLIREQLASIVNMLVSPDIDSDMIDSFIGRLRFF